MGLFDGIGDALGFNPLGGVGQITDIGGLLGISPGKNTYKFDPASYQPTDLNNKLAAGQVDFLSALRDQVLHPDTTPSAVDYQTKQSQDQNANNALAIANSSNGVNQGLALRTALNTNATSNQDALRSALIARLSERGQNINAISGGYNTAFQNQQNTVGDLMKFQEDKNNQAAGNADAKSKFLGGVMQAGGALGAVAAK